MTMYLPKKKLDNVYLVPHLLCTGVGAMAILNFDMNPYVVYNVHGSIKILFCRGWRMRFSK